MNSDTSDPPFAPESPPTIATKQKRKRNPYRHADRPGVPLMLTVLEAAETLRTTPEALRARLRRAQVAQPDGSVTAPLAPGIVGLKMGANTWRIRFETT
ncbi:MAG TPA: hypothetical protein VFK05_07405 [Polyangiaceae bacterium]|nr:hypothetical protein [Polyangiaceae bacterium]